MLKNFIVALLIAHPLQQLVADETLQEENTELVEENAQDVWFGPGYYYGIWFNDESDYDTWRGDHQEYPPNQDYYSPDHPIEYTPKQR